MTSNSSQIQLDQPLISIIALCYNHANYVEETLQSILHQNYANIEIIVLDDASTDTSQKIIQNWIDSSAVKCTFIKHSTNKGVCKSLNEAILLSNGEYYSPISCDDKMLPDKIQIQIKHFSKLDNSYGVIYSDAGIIDEDGKEQILTMYQEKQLFQLPSEYVYIEQAKNNFILHMTCLVRKSAFISIGGFDEDLSFEDVDFFLRLSKQYKFYYCPIKSGLWRRHSGNMTNKLYDEPEYLLSRLKAYLKHTNENNVEVEIILLPKIEKIITILYKQHKLYITKIALKPTLKKLNFLFRFMILFGLPYKIYFSLKLISRFLRELYHIIKIPTALLEPTSF